MNPEAVSFRLSPQQQAMLSLGTRAGQAQCAVVLDGPVDPAALRSALDAAVARHEILRTTLVRPAGVLVPQQVIHDELAPLWREDRAPADAADDPAALDALLAVEAQHALDVAGGPVLAATLLALGTDRHLLLLTAAAVCADADALVALVRELGARAPADDPLQYADYAEWRHALLTEEDGGEAAARPFWRAEDPSWPSLTLLFGAADGPSGAQRSRRRVPLATEAVRRAAAGHGVSADLFLEACWHATLARLTGEEELVLARTEHGRSQPDLAGAIGPYAQLVPMASAHGAHVSLPEVIDQVSRARNTAARLADYAAAEHLAAFTDRVRIGFDHADVRLDAPIGSARAEIAALVTCPVALALQLSTRDDGRRLAADVTWDPAAYDADDIATVASAFGALLDDAVVMDPPTPALRIVTAHQRAALVAAAAGPAAAERATPVHELFAERARREPGQLAVRAGTDAWTAAELDAAAEGIAARLRAAGVRPGDCVGLCMDRSPAMLGALLGILKAGGAYVPLNLEHPRARLAHQLQETAAAALVTQRDLCGGLPPFDGPLVLADEEGPTGDAPGQGAPTAAGDLAYVIYTSGSTGLPKGVAVSHQSLSVYAQGMAALLGADGGRSFAVVSAISTDLGNTCIFPALVSGGCVDLVAPDVAMDPDALVAHALAHPYDVLKITPSHLRTLLAGDGAEGLLPRRTLVVGGEALPWALVDRVRELAPQLEILNHYGPTEATVGCCALPVADRSAATTGAATVPIGRALAGDRVYVLGAEGDVVPAGVPGELCIGGAGVARGYIARPDETATRFVEDPFSATPGERLYRTGDRVRLLRDGTVEFLGRLDDQLKIRGNRVEPAEIEAALLRHPAVRQAAVAPRETEAGELRLVAYVVASPVPGDEELRGIVAELLPEHAIPSVYLALDALPFTPSGKVDRRALPEPESITGAAGYVAPRDPLEEEIAGIWSGLLKVERVGVHDDFFALGGHSLLATQAIMAIRKRHGDVPLRALLAAPTVAALADAVRAA